MAAKLVEYLATTRLGKRGTLILPKQYCDALRLKAGAVLTVLRIGDGLILMPEQKQFNQLCEAIATRFEDAGITEADLQATLPEVREQLARRRYPQLFAGKKQRVSKAKAVKAKSRQGE